MTPHPTAATDCRKVTKRYDGACHTDPPQDALDVLRELPTIPIHGGELPAMIEIFISKLQFPRNSNGHGPRSVDLPPEKAHDSRRCPVVSMPAPPLTANRSGD